MNRVLPSRDRVENRRSTINEAVQDVRRVGWCVLKNIIPAAEAERIGRRVLRVAAEVREGVGQTLGLINFDQSFAPYLADERILGSARALFGPYVRLRTGKGFVEYPGSKRGTLHADGPFNQNAKVRVFAPYQDAVMQLTTW